MKTIEQRNKSQDCNSSVGVKIAVDIENNSAISIAIVNEKWFSGYYFLGRIIYRRATAFTIAWPHILRKFQNSEIF